MCLFRWGFVRWLAAKEQGDTSNFLVYYFSHTTFNCDAILETGLTKMSSKRSPIFHCWASPNRISSIPLSCTHMSPESMLQCVKAGPAESYKLPSILLAITQPSVAFGPAMVRRWSVSWAAALNSVHIFPFLMMSVCLSYVLYWQQGNRKQIGTR